MINQQLNEEVFVPPMVIQNSMWAKIIPKINNAFMIISLVLVFGIDLLIIILDSSLIEFWYKMLEVFAVFACFFFFENFVFNKKFVNSTSALDGRIRFIIVIRNLLFLLNFIPFVQILGLMVILPVGLIIGSIYILLINARYNQIEKVELN
jgi:hypothetical protein